MSRPLKIVLIGCSGHYQALLDAVQADPSLRLAAFSKGSRREEADWFPAEYASYGFGVYDDWKVMLERERPDVAVVDSCFDENSLLSEEVLRRGIHCYSEKPAALTSERLESLRRAVEAGGAAYASMLEMRTHPEILTLRRRIERGEIGEVLFSQAQKSYQLGSRPAFYHRRESYGGTIPWVGIHGVDMIAWSTGLSLEPLSAFHVSTFTRGNGTMETMAVCGMRLGEKGMANLTLDYLMPDGAPSHGDDRLRVAGTGGILEARDGKAMLTTAQGVRELPLEPGRNLFVEFVNRLRGEPSICPTGPESLRLCELTLRLQEMADRAASFPRS